MKKFLIILAVLVVLALGWSFLRPHAVVAEDETGQPAAKVETALLKEESIARTIGVLGVVATAPAGEHAFPALYECIVRKLNVSLGSPVAAGDVLMELEPSPDELLLLGSAGSVLTLADKTLAATKERFDLKLATSQDLLAAQQAADDARFRFASLEARGVNGDGAVRASSGGVVSRLELSVGAQLPAGTMLVTVADGAMLEARLGVEASDLPAVVAGQAVVLVSSHRTGAESIATTVRSVGAALDAMTGAAEVRATLPAGAALLLGEHVRAEIEVSRKDRALVVPRSAVLPDEDKHVLYVVKAGKAVRHEVTVGLTSGEKVEVIGEGLQAGDVVVTLGNYELEDGMAIQPPDNADSKGDAKAEATP